MEKVEGAGKSRVRRVKVLTEPIGPMVEGSVLTVDQSHAAVIVAAQDLGIPADRIFRGIGTRRIQLAETSVRKLDEKP